MKELDDFITFRAFNKYLECSGIDEFDKDAFRWWLEENDFEVVEDPGDDRYEMFELLQSEDLQQYIEDPNDMWFNNEYGLKLLELYEKYQHANTCRVVGGLFEQLRSITIREN